MIVSEAMRYALMDALHAILMEWNWDGFKGKL
jgi:hypothetical protein